VRGVGHKAESRKQKAESRKQKTENRKRITREPFLNIKE